MTDTTSQPAALSAPVLMINLAELGIVVPQLTAGQIARALKYRARAHLFLDRRSMTNEDMVIAVMAFAEDLAIRGDIA